MTLLTNQDFIDKALGELHVIDAGAGSSANSTDSATALAVLNAMMAEWGIKDRDFDWFYQDTLTDVPPIPTWAESAVISNLAIACSPEFNAPVSAETAHKAEVSLNAVTVKMIYDKQTPVQTTRRDITNDL